ncbi:universal stress protein [Desulfonatronum thioautotrophicum]|uniref:universal stress protein n=1 Tax=Desulfonatronum thioautotrophicum TaxID=617001 RepID=UPI0005EAEEC4|nr:universal stress protein [Desulfonatronum thioautotrophicum]
MEKHLLLAVGDDQSSLQAVRFVNDFFTNKSDVRLTLLYVAPHPPAVYLDDSDVYQRKRWAEDWKRGQERRAMELLAQGKTALVDSGFKDDLVSTKFVFSQYGSARDLIQECAKGHFDALVLGRRGLSRFEELFVDSVTKRIMNEELSFPIWVCQRPERGRKHVLVAVDGSEPCVQIADHVGFIVADQPEQKIVLAHIPSSQASESTYQEFFGHALASLLENGVPEERIETKVLSGIYPAAALQQEADSGRYAVVAVGRTGASGPGFFSMGSVSRSLLAKLEGAALWVSPSSCRL